MAIRRGTNGDDILTGTTGDDIFIASAGADHMIGGNGADTVDYSAIVEQPRTWYGVNGVYVDLSEGFGGAVGGERNTYSGIENITGSNFDDALLGDNTANVFRGLDGNDIMEGLGGGDRLEGGAAPASTRYQQSTARVVVDLLNNTASGGHATGDSISGFENLTGSRYSDVLSGGNDDNRINGGRGADSINGRGGNDTINGGEGNDVLTGGSGFVQAGGTLGGNGTVGSVHVFSGGTLSPGNSIGTLTVGSLTMSAASTYLLEVSPTGSDRVNVTGTATPNGAGVSAIYAPGSYISRRYIILTATGGVTDTFGSLVNTNLPPNFTPSLSYDPNNAYLNLTLNFTPPPPAPTAPNFGNGLTRNQAGVANALIRSFNTAGGIPLAFGALTPQGLTQVSGEGAASTQQTTFTAMGQFASMLTDPSLGERGTNTSHGGATSYAEVDALAYASKRKGRNPSEQDAYAAMVRKAPPRVSFERRWSVWGAGYGGTQSTDGNAATGTAQTNSRVYGGAAGFDYRLTPDTLVGFALGGAGTRYNLANALGGGSSEMFQAGIYGRHTIGAAYLAGSLAYGWQDFTTERNVFLNQYRANFDANALTGRLEGGYRFAYGANGITPYAAGQFTTFWLPNYAEQVVAGTNLFALSYQERDVTASRSELGLRGDTSFAIQDAVVTLRGRAAWTHNFNTDRSVSTIFQTLPASGFIVNGAAQAHDAALVTASATTRWLNGFSVAATFEGEFSRVTDSYAGKAIVRYQW